MVVGPGARVPGAEHVVEVAHGVRRVAGAHQLLGGLRLGLAAVQPAAARVVPLPRAAGAVAVSTPDSPVWRRRPQRNRNPTRTGDAVQLLWRWVAWRRDFCSHGSAHRWQPRRAPRVRPRPEDAARRDARQPARRPARGPRPVAGAARLRGHRHPAARAGADRRPRRRAARRARPGQDPAAAHPGRPARRVDAGDRRLRARRAPLRADHPRVAAPARARARRRPAGRVAAPRRAVRREAGHPRHQRRRPDRRRGPDEGRRGPLARRPGDHPLRPDPAQPPRHRGDQRAARPRRADPGRDAQRDGGARHPDPRLRAAAAARRARRRQRQPRGLHQPRPDHHAAQGPVRRRDPHPLPDRARGRGRGDPAGGAPRRRRTRPPRRDPGPVHPQPARVQRRSTSARASRARFAIAGAETIAAAALHRATSQGEDEAVARVVDLETAVDVLGGKIEFETGEEGREAEILTHLLRTATAETVRQHLPRPRLRAPRRRDRERR